MTETARMLFAVGVVPHKEQRYDTVGDWVIDPKDGCICAPVSEMPDWRYEVLVGIHELIEAILCRHRGVSEEAVNAFDMKFEADRKEFGDFGIGEPGDHPDAPYRREHFFATSIERLLAAELGVDWAEYDAAVMGL